MGSLIDLSGNRFGRWTVIALQPKRLRYGKAVATVWLCRCDCGTERLVLANNLRTGTSTSCGCCRRNYPQRTKKLIDLNGQRFGRWLVLGLRPKRKRYGRYGQSVQALWDVRCDCGIESRVFGSNLRRGLSKSCGCLIRDRTRELNRYGRYWGRRKKSGLIGNYKRTPRRATASWESEQIRIRRPPKRKRRRSTLAEIQAYAAALARAAAPQRINNTMESSDERAY